MGFFSKLKQNFNHGGVKVEIQIPDTVSFSDPSFNVAITITNSSEAPQTVKSVTATLTEDRLQSMNTSQNNSSTSSSAQQKELSKAQDATVFVLQPNEPKQMSLMIPLNIGSMAAEMLPENGFAQAAASVLGGLQKAADMMDNSSFAHYVDVVADVDGISFDPSARKQIQVLKPGQFGKSIHFQI